MLIFLFSTFLFSVLEYIFLGAWSSKRKELELQPIPLYILEHFFFKASLLEHLISGMLFSATSCLLVIFVALRIGVSGISSDGYDHGLDIHRNVRANTMDLAMPKSYTEILKRTNNRKNTKLAGVQNRKKKQQLKTTQELKQNTGRKTPAAGSTCNPRARRKRRNRKNRVSKPKSRGNGITIKKSSGDVTKNPKGGVSLPGFRFYPPNAH